MLRPKAASEGFVEEIFRIVQIHFDFFEDDLLFVFYVAGSKARMQAEITDDVESDRKIFVEDFGVEADLFFGGESVEHAADGIHFASDIFGGAAFGAFEDHVLDEMSDAVFLRNFAAGAVANPDADGDGADVRHRLGNDDEAVGEDVALNVADLRSHSG